MTIQDAINSISVLKPSQYDDETLVRWLSEMDGRLMEAAIGAYAMPDGWLAPTLPYDVDAQDTVLLVPFPHDDIYLKWLAAQIDYHNGEMERYDNDMLLYNALLHDYLGVLNRTKQVKTQTIIRI